MSHRFVDLRHAPGVADKHVEPAEALHHGLGLGRHRKIAADGGAIDLACYRLACELLGRVATGAIVHGRAPSLANACVVARPMPPVAAVTSTPSPFSPMSICTRLQPLRRVRKASPLWGQRRPWGTS
jgi:hypothetical protein